MGNKYDDIEKLLELKKKGTITEEEFETEKRKILNDTPNNIENNDISNKKAKQKIKPWQIVVMIILIILARFYNSRSCERIYQQ